MRLLILTYFFLISVFSYAQSWQDVGGGTNNSSHGMLTWNGQLVNLGSYNNPCNRVSTWDGTNWNCLGGGVGIVARAGTDWNGNLVVVGDFWNNFQPCSGCNGVAVWDGSTWSALDQGFNNDVLTCTVYNGDLIIGGDFTEANGIPISRVARWNSTLMKFETMGTDTSFDNDVRCMTVFNGELYVGGDFNNVDGNPPSDGLVKWDPSTQSWVGGNSGVDLVGGVNETVRVLYVNPNDGNLYMGGHFPELIDGDSINPDYNMAGIAMYDGSNWFSLGTGLDNYCRAIHEYNGNLIVGGYFNIADGVTCNRIAKWNTTTQTFSPMGLGFDGIGPDEYVKSATVWNGIFFAGGAYTQAEGSPMNYIAQWYEPPTTQPTAAFTPSSVAECEGGCINFIDNSTNNPTTWAWTFPGSTTPSSSNQHPTNICYPTGGNYIAKLVACNGNGCDSATVNITISSTAIANPSTLIGCDSLLYNTTMYYNSTSVSDTVFGGSAEGCDSITNQQIIINSSVVVNQSPVVACDSALINGVWYYSSQTVSDFYQGGASTGCDSTDVTVLTINTVDETITVSNDTITSNATGATYQWLNCDNNYAVISGETNQEFIAQTNGNYAVQVTQNGCADTSVCELVLTTTVNNAVNYDVQIYPNPTKGYVNIDFGNTTVNRVQVITVDGRIIINESNVSKATTINLEGESKGVFFLKLELENKVTVIKLLKL